MLKQEQPKNVLLKLHIKEVKLPKSTWENQDLQIKATSLFLFRTKVSKNFSDQK